MKSKTRRSSKKNSEHQQKVTRKAIFSVKQKAQRRGMSTRRYVWFRAIRNLQTFVDGVGFNVIVAVLILVSVVLIFAEFLVAPGNLLDRIVALNDIITWLFVAELSLRFVVAPSKRIFLGNYWIDILAVLPVLRIFRTLRLVRLLRLLRLSRAAVILLRQSGWLSARLEQYFGSFGVLLLTAVMLIVCGTLAMLTQISPESTDGHLEAFFEKIWLATFLFVSGEPVGEIPATITGRIVAVLISISGLVVFAFLVGTVTASMTAYFRTKMEEKDLSLEHLKDHTIICGWDRMGGLILSELESVSEMWSRGVVVVAETDTDIAAESGIKNPRRLFHVREDFTKMDTLERIGAKRARAAVVLADKGDNLRDQDRDARTVLAALTLEKLNPEIFTCAELLDEVNATHLRIAGVEEIISRTNVTAGLFTATLVNRGISSVIGDILTHKQGTYMRRFEVPAQYVGRTFIDVFEHFKREFDATILAVDWTSSDGKYGYSVNPPGDRSMSEKDVLIVVANVDSAFKELAS